MVFKVKAMLKSGRRYLENPNLLCRKINKNHRKIIYGQQIKINQTITNNINSWEI